MSDRDTVLGTHTVRAVDPEVDASRRYVDETMVLETTWTTATETATATDARATG
jgi:alpha,alpha-trehalase